MSFVIAMPEWVELAAVDVARLGSTLKAAHAAATTSTTGVLAPAVDEVSQAITALLDNQAREFQALSAGATLFHERFAKLLNGGAVQYVTAEAANSEQILVHAVNATAQVLPSDLLEGTGQGASVAAAIAIPAQTFFSLPIGPFELYAQASPAFGSDIGLRLNTPLGSVTLFTEGVSFLANNDSFGWKFHFGNPLLYFGTLYDSGQTGYIFNGLTLSWPGPSMFGGILPNVGYTPWGGPPLLYDVIPTTYEAIYS